jgi:hypothetical protein
VTGHSADGHAAEQNCRAGTGWVRLALAASVAVAALGVVTDVADARALRRNSDQRQAVKKALPAAKGQLLIAVSLGSQRLTVYDDGVPIAHSPVSSGTVGHATPTGVFSIIQKNRHHRSNIYSGAPMPFMQRITWSGVALHAGVVPGYPASHGCIRLPNEFAARLWGMTRLGARVIIARDDVTPVAISHARLTLLQTPVMATADDKRADLLRPGIGIEEPVAPAVAGAVRTADASAGTVLTDASAPPVPPPAAMAGEAAVTSVEPPAAVSPDAAAPPPSARATHTSDEAVSPAAAEAAHATAVPEAVPATEEAIADKPSAPAAAASAVTEPAPPAGDEVPRAAAVPAQAALQAAPEATPDITSAIDLALPSAVPAALMPAAAAAPAGHVVSPPAADTASSAADPTTLAALPLDEVFVPPERPARPLRSGPVSVFISRKDARLYVRKRFDPLFSVPVVIKADQPIGTHVYTAAEGEGGIGLRWIAASLPGELPKAAKNTHMDSRKPDRRLGATAGTARANSDMGRGKVIAMPAMLPPSTAAEALDRVDLPAEVVAQIAGLMSPGASIIISDQGLGHETGLETDFIVLAR